MDSGQKHAGMTPVENGHLVLWSGTNYDAAIAWKADGQWWSSSSRMIRVRLAMT